MKKAMSTHGMDLLQNSYLSMTPARIVTLADRFKFDYIVTPVSYDTQGTSLTLVKSEAENRYTGDPEDDYLTWHLYLVVRN